MFGNWVNFKKYDYVQLKLPKFKYQKNILDFFWANSYFEPFGLTIKLTFMLINLKWPCESYLHFRYPLSVRELGHLPYIIDYWEIYKKWDWFESVRHLKLKKCSYICLYFKTTNTTQIYKWKYLGNIIAGNASILNIN